MEIYCRRFFLFILVFFPVFPVSSLVLVLVLVFVVVVVVVVVGEGVGVGLGVEEVVVVVEEEVVVEVEVIVDAVLSDLMKLKDCCLPWPPLLPVLARF